MNPVVWVESSATAAAHRGAAGNPHEGLREAERLHGGGGRRGGGSGARLQLRRDEGVDARGGGGEKRAQRGGERVT
jgi:hypothetical protein